MDETSITTTINPAQPSSLGALLSEEWTINPYSTLPSFLEMVLIAEASRSTHTAIGTALEAISRSLSTFLQDYDDDSSSSQFLRWIRWHVTQPAARFLQRYKTELQYLSVYLLERQCLHSTSSNSATASESLYGAKRVKLEQPATAGPSSGNTRRLSELSDADKTRAVLMVALLPYLRERLDRFYRHSCSSSSITTTTANNWKQRLTLRVYPSLCTTLYLLNLFVSWRYLLGRSVFYDLRTLLLQQVVRRVAQSDRITSSSNEKKKDDQEVVASNTRPSRIDEKGNVATTDVDTTANEELNNNIPSVTASSLATRSMLYLVSASVAISWLAQIRSEWCTLQRNNRLLLLQQQQQQQQQQHSRGSTTTTTTSSDRIDDRDVDDDRISDLVPPPPPPTCGLTGAGRTSNQQLFGGACPLCRRTPRVLPTACPSGFVFCHSCVLAHVRQHQTCPVTGDSCSEARLVRLYEPRQEL